MNTDRFSVTITSTSANNIVTLVDFNQILTYYEQFKIENIVEHSVILEDLQAKVGLFTLLEADWPDTNALASESAMEAARTKILKDGQKIYLELYTAKGTGPWQLEGEEILQNKNSLEQPWALMAPWFSTNETALLGESLKIGVRIANKAQGTGGLKGSDYIRIFGTWRKVTNFRKKKDDNEALANRISALETLLDIFGAPSATLSGSNGLVPAPPAGSADFLLRGDRGWENPNKFATPAQITAAINALVGNSSAALDTIAELGAALANDANFAATITNALASKVGLTNAEIISGAKTLSSPLTISNSTPATSLTAGGALNVAGGGRLQGNWYVGGFTLLGNLAVKMKEIKGTTNLEQGKNVILSPGVPLDKIRGFQCLVNYALGGYMGPNHTYFAGYQYDVYLDGGGILILNSNGNSISILNKPVSVLFTYIE